MGRPHHLPDPGAGYWLTEYLTELDGSVGQVVPAAYEAYARVLHPARTLHGADGDTSWRQVCAGSGATVHALMQWRSISNTRSVGPPDGPVTEKTDWSGAPPDVGNMPERTWAALSAVLDASGADRPWFLALWEGLGWVDARGARAGRQQADGSWVWWTPPSAYPDEVLDAPRLHLPARSYLLFTGGPGDTFGDGDRLWPQVPNLCWPGDRSWCTATEIDFDSTLVGGDRALVDAVLAHPELEAWEVGPGDLLTYDADLVNGVPAAEPGHR